jgi:RimJ/RimL family protein N-acetyltransferase
LAQEALSAVCSFGFRVMKLPEITADVDPRNDRSLRLLLRLGFLQTGAAKRTWKIGDEWCDSVYPGLTAGTWNSREQRPTRQR